MTEEKNQSTEMGKRFKETIERIGFGNLEELDKQLSMIGQENLEGFVEKKTSHLPEEKRNSARQLLSTRWGALQNKREN